LGPVPGVCRPAPAPPLIPGLVPAFSFVAAILHRHFSPWLQRRLAQSAPARFRREPGRAALRFSVP